MIDQRRRAAPDLVTLLVIPAVGFAFVAYLWSSLSQMTFVVGLGWAAFGLVYLIGLTRGFTQSPPASTGRPRATTPSSLPAQKSATANN